MDVQNVFRLFVNVYLIFQHKVLYFFYGVYLLVHFYIASSLHFLCSREPDGTDAFLSDNFRGNLDESKEPLHSPSTPTTYRAGWLTVNGVSSHVLTWGGWVEDPPPKGDTLILFMCGVPGITLFYRNFLETLHTNLGIPVWTICVAGHELPFPSSQEGLPDNPKLYNNVKAQVDHKMAFIKSYVPRNRKIFLIGHSFGAKMVTELLKDEQVSEQMQKCVLLMPTLERFKDTPRAQFWLLMLKVGFIYPLILCIRSVNTPSPCSCCQSCRCPGVDHSPICTSALVA
uniref:Lipid droplet-associated hydrolase n=2 Tax=Graphocephala atropunctata TaxID=36148 RepID=A0A1B6L6E2_9HEMI